MRASILIAALTVAPFVASSARAQSDQKPKALVTASRDRDDDDKLRGDRDDDKKCRHRKASANANEHGANRQKAAEKDCAAPPPPPPPPPSPPPPPPPPAPASTVDISGSVFFDLDANGVLDPDEVGLSGWQVQVTGPTTQTVSTDGNGSFSFTGLTAGNYTVCVLPPMGWTQVSPTGGATCSSGIGYSVLPPAAAGNVSFSGVNFGFVSQ